MKIKNAVIVETRLLRTFDEFHLSIFMQFDNKKSIGIGGYIHSRNVADAMFDILNVVGVDAWEDISGSRVRVKYSDAIYEIGNESIDNWLDLRNFFANVKTVSSAV